MRATGFFIVAALFVSSRSTVQAQSFLDRLENALRAPAETSTPAKGASPGYLGLTADESGGTGVVVLDVRASSPAGRAGLAPGDVIVAIDDNVISTLDEMAARLAGQPAGSRINFEVIRRGDRRVFPVTLSERPVQDDVDLTAPRNGADLTVPRNIDNLPSPPSTSRIPASPRATSSRPSLGATVVDLSESLRRQYGVIVSRGALITAVQAGSPAERYGIPVGAVIVAADGARIDGYDDLVRYLATRRAGETVEFSYYQGNQLARRVVRLTGTPETATQERYRVYGDEPRGIAESERPAARILGRVLDTLSPTVESPGVGASVADIYEMRRQIQLMQGQIDNLEQRIRDLESRAAADAARRVPANP